MEIALNSVEARVLGVLIEKEMSTPDYYPLTLNALVNGCNQKTNRDPVMDLEESLVSEALDRLRADRLVWQVKAQGSRALKYEHNLKEVFELSSRELAILCELLLRGPQTAGELRSRTARLVEFPGLPAVEHALKKLAEHEKGPFVLQLPRQPGQKESRHAHLLGDLDPADLETVSEAATVRFQGPDRVTALDERVAALETELAELKAAFEAFRKSFE